MLTLKREIYNLQLIIIEANKINLNELQFMNVVSWKYLFSFYLFKEHFTITIAYWISNI